MAQHVWWTGPTDTDCVEVHVKPDEVAIWQHCNGNISSVTMTPQVAEELANYLKAIL